jgi:hypothetical protein
MADLWTDELEDGLLDRWRAELALAVGRLTPEIAVTIEGAVLSRRVLLGLEALARLGDDEPEDAVVDDAIGFLAAYSLVSLARRFRALGLKRDDVRRLDFGRRRRRHADA